jgi:phosphocarrier protein
MPIRKLPGGRKDAQKIERDIAISNKLGLHARPAALFVQTANRFEAGIEIRKDDMAVDGKSIMGIMTLAAEMGSSIKIVATGKDAEAAMNALVQLIESNFGE